MAKEEKKLIVKDASGVTVAEIVKGRHTMIPVEPQVKADLIRLCIANGGGVRSQGAMVKRLVNEALAKLPKAE
jgi:hypothetical protein